MMHTYGGGKDGNGNGFRNGRWKEDIKTAVYSNSYQQHRRNNIII